MTRALERRSVVLWAVAIAGYALLADTLLSRQIDEHGGTGSAAADAFAYWAAGRHLLAGQPVYGLFAGAHGAYLYPPPLAQAVAPAGLLPLPVFVWGWRAAELLALRWIVRSWRNAGIALLVFPALLGEIEAGNVNLFVAAATASAIRGDGRWLSPVALTKFATLAALPAGFVRDRKRTLAGIAAALLLAGLSFAVAPGLWAEWLRLLPQAGDPSDQFYNVGRLVPTEVRFIAAGILALAAIRAPILAPVAVTLATPVLWFHNLSILVACVAAAPRLLGEPTRLTNGLPQRDQGVDLLARAPGPPPASPATTNGPTSPR